jgi:23S rRNA (guanosine2251-2'-O)-methyltransferase
MNRRKRFANSGPAPSAAPSRNRNPKENQADRPRSEQPARTREPRERRGEGRGGASGNLWLYGTHAVAAALANPDRYPKRLMLATGSAAPKGLPDGLQPEFVDRQVLDQILGRNAVHQGIALLVSPLPDLGLDEACEPVAGRRNIVVLLDQVTDPHNVGAILRSAAAFGARAVVVTDRHAPDATATLAKSASGALERIPLVRITNLARALDDLGDHGYWRIGLDGHAKETVKQAIAGQTNIAIVLGAEGEGLRRLTGERCDQLARLPISDAVESLNVSNAAAVALYAITAE